jgi:hypothetical protein
MINDNVIKPISYDARGLALKLILPLSIIEKIQLSNMQMFMDV